MSNNSNPDNPSGKERLLSYLFHLTIGLLLAFILFAVTKPREPMQHRESSSVIEQMRNDPSPWKTHEESLSRLFDDLEAGRAQDIGISFDSLLVSTSSGAKYFVSNQGNQFANAVVHAARNSKGLHNLATLNQASKTSMLSVAGSFISLLFSLSLMAFLVYFLNNMRKEARSGTVVGSAGKNITTRFDDVIGVGEAKTSLQDVVSYLKEPERYQKLGARPPAGVLLLGSPGVGKTLLARALAGECNASFISATGSDFTSKYMGMGVQKVKGLFEKARKSAPCILFIDEIDGIASRTEARDASGAESNRIINQVLAEMDGFDGRSGVVVVGATNLADNLDPALLREGRFDRQIQVKLPDVLDRVEILKLYAKKITLSDEHIDYEQLARFTTGFSPATLNYVVNHAALLSARTGLDSVGMEQFLEAIETAHMGELNGGQRALSQDERHRIAAHEAGHAVVAAVLNVGVVEKVTILPRGGALGVTLVTQPQDTMLSLRSDIERRIQMLLAGRNAELQVFGEASSGAAHDLQECSRLALNMVSQFGFGEDGALFSVAALPASQASQATSKSIEQANLILTKMNEACVILLENHRDALETLTQELLEFETVMGERVRHLVQTQAGVRSL